MYWDHFCGVVGGLGGGVIGGELGEIVETGADRTIEWMGN